MRKPTPLTRRLLDMRVIPVIVAVAFLAVQVTELVTPAQVQASPTISAGTTGTISSASSKTISYNAGTGTGRVLVVAVGSNSRTAKINSITYGGVAMTQALYKNTSGTTGTAATQIFYLVEPASGANNLIFTASASGNYAYVVAYVSGADTTDALGTVDTNSGSSGSSYSVTNTPVGNDSLILAAFSSDSTVNISSGYTEVGDISLTGVRTGLYASAGSYAGDPETINATGGSAAWSAGTIEIKTPVELPVVTMDTYLWNDIYESQTGEGQTYAVVRLMRSGDTSDDLYVSYDMDDSTAANSRDYRLQDYLGESSSEDFCQEIDNNSAVIPADKESCYIVVQALEDEEEEDTEQVVFILGESSEYELDHDADSAQIYIYDVTAPSGCDPDYEVCDGTGEAYTVESPGFASMYLYDDDLVAAGTVNTFAVSPLRVKAGQSATLSWNVTGMTSGCSISPGIGSVDNSDGAHTVSTPAITQRATFTLTCSDGANPAVVQTATVGIIPSFIEQ